MTHTKNFLRSVIINSQIYLFMIVLISASLSAQSFTKITDSPAAIDSGRTLGISFVDFDGDGDLDIYSNDLSAPIVDDDKIYKNMLVETGTAEFVRFRETGDLGNQNVGTFGNTWTDVDNDGDLDVYVSAVRSKFYINNGDGTFTLIGDGTLDWKNVNRSWSGSSADWNSDGFTDLLLVHAAGFLGPVQVNHMFVNNGDGTFAKVDSGASAVTTGFAPYTCANWADYDRDGDLDLFIGSGPADGSVAGDYIYKNLLKETGSATFERLTGLSFVDEERDGQVYNWIDYDNDGDLDVCVTNYWGGLNNGLPNELWRNDNGEYVKITEGDLVTDDGYSLANVWGDYDNDGDVDVYITNDAGLPNRYYTNNGDGTFTALAEGDLVNKDPSIGSYGASAGDYDNDGDLDLIVGNGAFLTYPGTPNFLFRNDNNNNNSWVNLKCVGVQTNKAATGTEIWAKATINGHSYWQYRTVSSSNSFNGQNDLRIHFGFGDATTIDSLKIVWLSGNEDVYTNVAVNKFYTAVEGDDLTETSVTSIEREDNILPAEFSLEQNYPNPFNPSTTIKFSIPQATNVKLSIYNMLGEKISELINSQLSAGNYNIPFNAEKLSSGVYIYKLDAGQYSQSKKMQLIK